MGDDNITGEQRWKLNRLWFIYGNRGKKHNHANHRFIQCLLEEGKDEREFYKPSNDCLEQVDRVLKGD